MPTSAPEGSDKRNIGNGSDALTKALSRASLGSSAISQAAPTPCIHAPRFDTGDAIYSARNVAKQSGAHIGSRLAEERREEVTRFPTRTHCAAFRLLRFA